MKKAALKRVSQHTGKETVLLSHFEGRAQFQDGQFRIREFVNDVKELVDASAAKDIVHSRIDPFGPFFVAIDAAAAVAAAAAAAAAALIPTINTSPVSTNLSINDIDTRTKRGTRFASTVFLCGSVQVPEPDQHHPSSVGRKPRE